MKLKLKKMVKSALENANAKVVGFRLKEEKIAQEVFESQEFISGICEVFMKRKFHEILAFAKEAQSEKGVAGSSHDFREQMEDKLRLHIKEFVDDTVEALTIKKGRNGREEKRKETEIEKEEEEESRRKKKQIEESEEEKEQRKKEREKEKEQERQEKEQRKKKERKQKNKK